MCKKSDHNIILLKLWKEASREPHPFAFEDSWTRDPSNEKITGEARSNGSHALFIKFRRKKKHQSSS